MESSFVSPHRQRPRGAKPVEPVNLDVRRYFESSNLEDGPDWLCLPETPSAAEVLEIGGLDDFRYIGINHIKGPWDSKEQYLKTHYHLLREDTVSSLRDAVHDVRKDPSTRDNDQRFYVYDSVYITGVTVTRSALAIRARFSTRRSTTPVDWGSSIRLRPGKLVALLQITDDFVTNCMVGTVASRMPELVQRNPPEVDIYLGSLKDFIPDPQQEWIMVEARQGYFEETKHTMIALQKLYSESFPLSNRICDLDPNVGVPDYIKLRPSMSFASLPGLSSDPSQVLRYNVIEEWPPLPMGELDEFQWSALKNIVTEEISITQGPPGTGKTFTSLTALRIMLANKGPRDPPIVIAARTNHALDQILKQVSLFEPNFIRLGKRSAEPEIRERTTYELRFNKVAPTPVGGMSAPAEKQHKILSKKIESILMAFTRVRGGQYKSDTPLDLQILVEHEILTEYQVQLLHAGAKGWVQGSTNTWASSQSNDISDAAAFRVWLGDEVTEFEYPYVSEFKHEDFYAEDIKEIDYQDKEGEMEWLAIKGRMIHFKPGFYGLEAQFQLPESKVQSYLETTNLWSIPKTHRGFVYDYLRKMLNLKIMEKLSQLQGDYEDCARNFNIGQCEQDHAAVRKANVIGMTTTGLSKYRGVIASVRPRVILIEEAASVMEAHVAVACLPSVQQLILIGDHQQLKAHCANEELAGEPFYLETSMFERLAMNEMKYTRLGIQRRMIPEIRRLVELVYKDLQDHSSVQYRRLIPGMENTRSFFFHHDQPERKNSLSFLNEFEAKMVVGLLGHLLMNGVPATEITILTSYQDQRKLIKRLIYDSPICLPHHVEVATIDSYQGEENRIILLSLVRSSEHRGIGFLNNINRSSVALSRARDGLFIFGNASCLVARSSFWGLIVEQMYRVQPSRLGSCLRLWCNGHKKHTLIRKPEDWDDMGLGCQETCEARLPCKHLCLLKCHGTDLHDVCGIPCDYVCYTCRVSCNQTCMPAHLHRCDCRKEDKDVPFGHIGRWHSYGNTRPALSGDEDHSVVRRGRSPGPRPYLPWEGLIKLKRAEYRRKVDQKGKDPAGSSAIEDDNAPSGIPSSRIDRQAEAIQKWRDFASHGAIEDDYRRAGLPVPPRRRSATPGPAPRSPARPAAQGDPQQPDSQYTLTEDDLLLSFD